MPVPEIKIIEADCSILLFRALHGKPITAFGDDGLGRHGRSQIPRTFLISDLEIFVEYKENKVDVLGYVCIDLQGYNATDVGHICTDQNFLISLGSLLSKAGIDPNCLTYEKIDSQGADYVSMHIDVPKLLQW